MPKGMFHNETTHEGATNVWLTPWSVIDTLGPFDLDPCAADPRPFACAERNFTEADDGFARPWDGFVWLNPPYGPHVGKWLDRLRLHGHGIALTFARTETRAIQRALRDAAAIFLPSRRITFLRAEPPHRPAWGSSGAPSVFIAYGSLAVERLCRFNTPDDGLLFYPNPATVGIEPQPTLFDSLV